MADVSELREVILYPVQEEMNRVELHHRSGARLTVQFPDYCIQETPMIISWLRNQRSFETIRAYSTNLGHFLRYVRKPLREVRIADLQDYAETLYALMPASQASMLSAVKSVLSYAHETGEFPRNIGAQLKVPRVNQHRAERILEEGQVLRMLALEQHPRNHLVLSLLYYGAMRISEVCSLTWRQVSGNREGQGQIEVLGKGEKERVVLVKPSIYQELQAFYRQAGSPSRESAVFLSRKHTLGRRGRPVTNTLGTWGVHDIVKKAATRAGVLVTFKNGKQTSEVSAHWLRHASASHALDRQCPLDVIRDTLGHSNISITNIYVHARPGTSSTLYLP